jgi:signal transduction histidine kinase
MAALDRVIQEIRRYIFDLRSAEQSRELERVLEGLVRDLRLDTLLEVDLEVVGQRCCWLDYQQVAHVTQVAREALSNVVQHAQASRVTVALRYEGDSTILIVTDDGQGLDGEEAVAGVGQGEGMANMHARARMLGGELVLDSRAGQGLAISLTVPCHDGRGCETEVQERESWA